VPGTELDLAERYQRQNKVIELHLEGHSPNVIAKKLNYKYKEVVDHIGEFNEIAKSDEMLRERGREMVHDYDESINRVQREMWRLAQDSEDAGDLKTRGTVLKAIADTQAKRVEVLQKSGVLADNKIVEEMAATEEKMRALTEIVREVSRHCDNCRVEIARKLSMLAGQAEEIVVIQ